jgi:N-hydroxyarylamine O-acetyltransferase
MTPPHVVAPSRTALRIVPPTIGLRYAVDARALDIDYVRGMDLVQLERYLDRVGYAGSREPTLEVLHALTAAHTQRVPFENLDVLLGRTICLDEGALFEKLVLQRRGGYCFEMNSLFMAVLEALGFDVMPLSARVRLDQPRDYTPARTHMFLRVQAGGGTWLTDVGVGAASLTSAIRFELDIEQATPHESRRIVREGDRYFHQIHYGDRWADVYEFSGEAMPRIDREVGNWYTSTHPKSHFKNRLIATRAGADGRRYTILNGDFKTRERDGHVDVRPIESSEQLLSLLAERFDLHLPSGTQLGRPWEQV